MKNDINRMNENQDHLSEQQLNELENDAVWTLLDNAEKGSSTEVNPMFARNVMREIRVNHTGATASEPSFLQRLISPRFNKIALGLGAVAACAVLVISQMSGNNQTDAPNSIATDNESSDKLEDISIEDIVNFVEAEEDDFTEEMLDLASQDPFFISEEEIEIAMQL